MNLLEKKIDRQWQNLQIYHSRPFLFGFLRPVGAKLSSKLAQFLTQKIILPFQLLNLQQKKLFLFVRTEIFLAAI